MGSFVVSVEAVGGHGCQRELKDGEVVEGCGLPSCPDCAARNFVKVLKDQGNSLVEATLTHWPGDPHTVVDNLLTKVRKGSF